MVELARLRLSRPAARATDSLRRVRLTDLRRLHWLLLAVIAMEIMNLAISLWRVNP